MTDNYFWAIGFGICFAFAIFAVLMVFFGCVWPLIFKKPDKR